MQCQEEPAPVKVSKRKQLESKAATADAESAGGRGRGRGRGKGRGKGRGGKKKETAEPETKSSKSKPPKDPTKEVDRIAGYTMEEWDAWWAQQVQDVEDPPEPPKKRRKAKQPADPAPSTSKQDKAEPSAPSKPQRSKRTKSQQDDEGNSNKKKMKEMKESNGSKEKESKGSKEKKPKEPKDEPKAEPNEQKGTKRKAKKLPKPQELEPCPDNKKDIKSEIFEFLMKSKDFTDDNAKEKLQEIMPNYQNCGVDCRLDTYWKRKKVQGVGVGVFSKGEQKNVGFFGFRMLTDNWVYAIAAAIKAGDILATLMHTAGFAISKSQDYKKYNFLRFVFDIYSKRAITSLNNGFWKNEIQELLPHPLHLFFSSDLTVWKPSFVLLFSINQL